MKGIRLKIFLLSLLSIILTFSIVISRITAYTLFLNRVGFRELPFAYMELSLLIIFFSILFYFLIDRIERTHLTYGLSFFYIFFLLFLPLWFETESSHIPFYLFLIVTEAIHTLLNINTWAISTELLRPIDSRRYFPFISLLSSVGALSGGFFPHIFHFSTIEYYIYAIILVFCLIVLITLIIEKRFYPHLPLKNIYKAIPGIKSGIRFVESWKFLIFLFLVSFSINFFDFNIDFIYNTEAKKSLLPEELPTFFGTVSIVTNVIELALLLTVSTKIFSMFGIANILFTFPTLILPLVSIYLFSPQLIFGVLLKIIDRISNYLFLNPAGFLFLQTFKRGVRGRVNLLMGGVIKGVGIISAGAFIYLFNNRCSTTLYVSLLIFLFLIMFLLIFLLKQAYIQTLIINLKSSALDVKRNAIQFLGERFHVPILSKILDKKLISEDDPLMGDLLMACGYSGDIQFFEFIRKHIESNRIHLKVSAIKSIANLRHRKVWEFLCKRMEEEEEPLALATIISVLSNFTGVKGMEKKIGRMFESKDSRILSNAIESAGRLGIKKLGPQIKSFIRSPNNRIQANAIVACKRLGLWDEDCREVIERNLVHSNPARVSSIIYAIGEAGIKEYTMSLKRFLDSNNFSIKKNTLLALLKLGFKDCAEKFVDLLIECEAEQKRDIASSIYSLKGETKEMIIEELWKREKEEREVIWHILADSGFLYPEELEIME